MELPRNGKVVIIDNEPSEAAPLLKVLSKNKIPHVYYSGDLDMLPDPNSPHDDVRVLFLDINLTNNAVYEATRAQLAGTLKRIIDKGTPYICAIWSNNQDDHRQLINDLFENHEPQIAPTSIIFLSKGDFFQYEAGLGYILDPSRPAILEEIQERIDSQLKTVDILKLLIEWENLIIAASTESIKGIAQSVENDEYWNKNLKHVFYKLAHAQLGKTIRDHGNSEIQKASLNTLTSSFNDNLEMRISNVPEINDLDLKKEGRNFFRKIENRNVRLKWEDFTYFLFIDDVQKSQNKVVEGLKANNNEDEKRIAESLKNDYRNISPKLNSELLLSKSPKVEFHPGNVFKRSVTGRKKRNLLKTYFPKIDQKKGGKYEVEDLTGFIFVEVECTPICDYSQSKRLRYRFLPGVLYQADTKAKLDDNLDSIYREIPPFLMDEKVYRLVFDYRLFKSTNQRDNEVNQSSKFLFRLKSELLTDIQARISSHINRPGIVTISS